MFNRVLFHCIVLHCMASYPPPTSPVWPNRSKASPASLPPQFRGVPEVLMRPRAALSLEGSSMLTTTLTNHETHTSPPPAHGSGRCETAPGEFPRRRRPWMELGIDISGYHGDVWRLNLLCFLSHIFEKYGVQEEGIVHFILKVSTPLLGNKNLPVCEGKYNTLFGI